MRGGSQRGPRRRYAETRQKSKKDEDHAPVAAL
jgi:hypothetical protein